MRTESQRAALFVLLPLLGAALAGCTAYGPCCDPCGSVAVAATPEAPTPVKPKETRPMFYDGTTGERVDIAGTLASWKDVDLVAFGELHGHPEGAKAELALLQGMAAQPRPVALAMEFFEADTQAALDAYLAGAMEEAEFRKKTRQGKAYPATHGPLIEFCKAHGIPVIAANAPRPLVSGYRKSDADDYAGYLAELSEEERGYLPAETSEIDDDYKKRFMALMGPKRGPSFFRSQSLWDDAMADSMARFREGHPQHRILFVVGGFHVRGHLGTIKKYRLRRADDAVRVLGMVVGQGGETTFGPGDKGHADVVLKVSSARPAP
jgi:uncharacterized iron-regulated protein